MTVSKRLRYEVLRRDNHTCRYCGGRAPDATLTVDHVVPKALGGGDEPANLVSACRDCNSGKAASNPDAPLVAEVDEKASQWAQALEIAIARRAEQLDVEGAVLDRFDKKWSSWKITSTGNLIRRDGNWRNTIRRFIASGLDERSIHEAVDTAIGKKTVKIDGKWPYFCGICWREIDGIHEAARKVLVGTPKDLDEDTEFPIMEVADSYLLSACYALGVSGETTRKVCELLWTAMADADATWRALVEQGEDDLLVPTLRAMDKRIAPLMNEIRNHEDQNQLEGLLTWPELRLASSSGSGGKG